MKYYDILQGHHVEVVMLMNVLSFSNDLCY